MTEVYKGYFKLVEEIGEVLQNLGKLGPFITGDHPDGGGPIRPRLEKELVDLDAAITYFASVNDLLMDHDRRLDKLRKFKYWGLTGLDDGEET